MRKLLLCLMAIAPFMGASAATADYNVVPLPQCVTTTDGGAFVLNADAKIVCKDDGDDMQRNATFLAKYIFDATGLSIAIDDGAKKGKAAIVLLIDNDIDGTEAYRLTVDEKQVTIAGSTAAGVFYGIQTLRKALPVELADEVYLPAVEIVDAPRFHHRGMMLDCARHFFSIDFVKRYIDIMTLHNMNVFHWHLSDDQGWRIEIKSHPELTAIGSVRSGTIIGHNSDVDSGTPYGGFYTQEEAREIVEYARQRYITVIPEIDMPGHMLAVLAAHPELGCTGGPYEVCHRWGIFEEVLCISNEQTYALLEDVIDEITDIFPSELIHIGGDECPTTAWASCDKCQAMAQAEGVTTEKLQSLFTNRMERYVSSKGRRIIGWDEILDGDISQSAVIQSWRGVEPGSKAAELGHDVIMSPTTHAYLDYYQTDDRKKEPVSIGGNLPIVKVYELDPAPADLSDEAKSHIIGAQGNLWTEYIEYPNVVEYMVMPRMAAMAEVQWTPYEKKNFDEFVERLTRLTKIYDLYGYNYGRHLWK